MLSCNQWYTNTEAIQRKVYNKTIELCLFWARLRLIISQVALARVQMSSDNYGPNVVMPKNINFTTIINTSEGIEKIKTEKEMTTKQSE